MESKPILEAELGKRIIYMHDVLKMSFRKISEKFHSEGIHDVGKDRANRLYWKYKALEAAGVEEDEEELSELSDLVVEAEKRVKIARKKRERKWRIASLQVQEADVSFEHRQKLFEDKMMLLDFAQKVLPLTNPALWLRLKKVCKILGVSVENALQEAIGPQTEYEQIRMESLDDEEEYPLDQHLYQRLEDWLSEQEEEIMEVPLIIEGGKRQERLLLQIPYRDLKRL